LRPGRGTPSTPATIWASGLALNWSERPLLASTSAWAESTSGLFAKAPAIAFSSVSPPSWAGRTAVFRNISVRTTNANEFLYVMRFSICEGLYSGDPRHNQKKYLYLLKKTFFTSFGKIGLKKKREGNQQMKRQRIESVPPGYRTRREPLSALSNQSRGHAVSSFWENRKGGRRAANNSYVGPHGPPCRKRKRGSGPHTGSMIRGTSRQLLCNRALLSWRPASVWQAHTLRQSHALSKNSIFGFSFTL
jgi:hypothetical protein